MQNITSIEAIYFTPSQIIEQKSFKPNVQFKEILDYFYSDIQINNTNLRLKQNYYYKQNQLNGSTNILNVINETETDPENDIDANEINLDDKNKIYIELIDTFDNQDNIPYILKPKSNPFEIIIYSINSKTFSSENFKDNIINTYNLDRYKQGFSAYCNSYDTLFISGGINKNKEPINDFWILKHRIKSDKHLFEIIKKEIPFKKKEHSMLFYKKNKTIIFVGGNDKKCFVYDLKKDNFNELPETNGICLKPALIIKNNILYVFDSFNRTKKFFEKIDLNKKDHFKTFCPGDYSLYNSKFFGICGGSKDNDRITFLGGEKNENNTIVYEIKNNNLVKSKGKDIYTKLDDKTFYKINQNYYGNIPDSKDKSLIVIYSRTNNVNKIIFDNEGKTTFNFDENEKSDISEKSLLPSLNKSNLNSSDLISSRSYNNYNYNEYNHSNINSKSGSIVMKIEQDTKEKEKSNEIKNYKFKNRREIKSERKIKNQSRNQNINNKNKNKLILPINLKLNQSQMIIGDKMNISNNKISHNNNNSNHKDNIYNNKKISDSMYLNNDDLRLNSSSNNYFNNYSFYEMKPNHKNKNVILNSSSNVEIRIKNPASKSKIIKRKIISGLNYSIICEKIVDKNNNNNSVAQIYDSVNMHENFALENEAGNHQLYISQYTDRNKNIDEDIDKKINRSYQDNNNNENSNNIDTNRTNKTERQYNNNSTYFSKNYKNNNEQDYNNKNNNNSEEKNKIMNINDSSPNEKNEDNVKETSELTKFGIAENIEVNTSIPEKNDINVNKIKKINIQDNQNNNNNNNNDENNYNTNNIFNILNNEIKANFNNLKNNELIYNNQKDDDEMEIEKEKEKLKSIK